MFREGDVGECFYFLKVWFEGDLRWLVCVKLTANMCSFVSKKQGKMVSR